MSENRIQMLLIKYGASQVVLVVKNLAANVGDAKDSLDSLVGKMPLSQKQQSTSVFLPGRSREQRSLVGYSL